MYVITPLGNALASQMLLGCLVMSANPITGKSPVEKDANRAIVIWLDRSLNSVIRYP